MMPGSAVPTSLGVLADRIVACRECPRMVATREALRAEHPEWWCRPVPGFGDRRARILLVGLAPGRVGSNRTGRMFTGDPSARFLMPALHSAGLANQPTSESVDDGLRLSDLYIAAAGRCFPPDNRPSTDELDRCRAYLEAELQLLTQLRVAVTLGGIAHEALLKSMAHRPSAFPFRHGAEYDVAWPAPDRRVLTVIASYHPSPQNTYTRRLTPAMFREIFARAAARADGGA